MIELKSVSGTCCAGAVRDVSFRLPNGKTYGVFSPHYADAVALLALMSGARTPSGGTILAGGFDLHREAKQARRGIGYLSADLLPDDEFTPVEYFMTIADARDLSYNKTIRRAHELLELAGLDDKKERLIANLSHGEKRILCLLQLLLGEPEILILTSPFADILPKDAQKIRELIKFFSDTYTIFLCTPRSEDLVEMCDEIIVLQDGMLKSVVPAQDESLAEVFAAAATQAPAVPESDESKSARASAIWKLLTQKSEDYEVLQNDEKEDNN